MGQRGTPRNLRGRERDEDNKDPILGDRPHLPIQLHHREDWIGTAWAACSTAHLKLKHHAHNNTITTLHSDIEAARRCFLQANKPHNSVSLSEQSSMDEGKTSASTLNSNLIELDPCFTKSEWKELKKEKKDPLNVEILRPTPDGDFELIPFGDDPTKCFKLGKGIPEHARAQLIACLRENADLFAWSATDMTDIDPSVACHQLTVSPSASVVAQRRRKQSPEKAEAAEKALKDLLKANFIS
jgi:hypothetical protein